MSETLPLRMGKYKPKIRYMNQELQLNKVRICHQNTCIQASGQNAKIITVAAAGMLLLFGIAALSRTSN